MKIKPDYAEAHYNLGVAFVRLGRIDEAMTHYRQAVEIKPDYAEAHNNLGNAFVRLNRIDEAMAQYQKAVKIQPDYAEAHYNLGNAFVRLNRINEAMAQYQKTVEIKPDYAGAHYNLGAAFVHLGRFDEAMAHYRKAVEIKPDLVEGHNNLAWLRATCPQASLRNGAEAIAHAQRANQLCGGRRPMFSTRWPPPTPKRDGFRKPLPPPAKPWTLPRNKKRLWRRLCGHGSRCTRPQALPSNGDGFHPAAETLIDGGWLRRLFCSRRRRTQ